MELSFRSLTAPLLLDGATGTMLQSRGMGSGVCSEDWILAHPAALLDVQRRYVAAGSAALYAPTFGANRISLGRYGLGERVRDYNLRLVALSREAAGCRAAVGGDLAPTGLVCGSADGALFESLVEVYREQAEALEEAGVDFYAVETQIALSEARAAVLAVKAVSKKPVLVSFTLSPGGKTFSGGDIRSALLSLQELGIDAFGLNCVGDTELLCRTLRELRPLTALPLLVKPNAGLPEKTAEGRSRYSLPPEAMADVARLFLESGADMLGGCCGTDERHIAVMAEALRGVSLPPHPLCHERYIASEYALLPWESESTELAVDAHLEENAADCPLPRLFIESEAQLHTVLDAQGTVRQPLCLRFANEALAAQFQRCYSGLARIL